MVPQRCNRTAFCFCSSILLRLNPPVIEVCATQTYSDKCCYYNANKSTLEANFLSPQKKHQYVKEFNYQAHHHHQIIAKMFILKIFQKQSYY